MDEAFRKTLAPHRRKIDAIDDRIIALLAKRYAIVRTIAGMKIDSGIKIVQSKRVREVKERNAANAKAQGISPELVRALYALIIDEAHVIEHGLEKAARKKT
jgi:4-amino-4-deoxychorismate mutase